MIYATAKNTAANLCVQSVALATLRLARRSFYDGLLQQFIAVVY